MLIVRRHFFPLFVTQFLGAFNDNLFKTALVVWIAYALAGQGGPMWVTVASGLFILPFFLFSPMAGQLAERSEKSALIRKIKLVEILIMGLAMVGFFLQNLYFLVGVLFLMGTQSAFFGPLKYSILPQHVHRHHLLAANGWIYGSTFVSILLGTVLGGVFVAGDSSFLPVALSVMLIALVGYLASRAIPKAVANIERDRVSSLRALKDMIAIVRKQPTVARAMVAISWFWFLGMMLLTHLPSFTASWLQASPEVATLLLALVTVGIGVGSALSHVIQRGHIHVGYAPIYLVGIIVFFWLLYDQSIALPQYPDRVLLPEFISSLGYQFIMLNVFAISVFGGLYVVPIQTYMQISALPDVRARVIATSNILNALLMVLASGVSLLCLSMGMQLPELWLMAALLSLPVLGFILHFVRKSEGV